ncbi:MAG: Crp/Fnr family transcriptional regulator [Bacteroidetes bacterium]|nr:Crp/Fnr family transcriptional regulator [Bacteroidota bacterium]
MDQSTIDSWVKEHFPQITDKALLREFSEYGKIRYFKAGELILDYGDYIRLAPLVMQGAIKVLRKDSTGREIFLYYLKEGDTCPASFICCLSAKKSIIRTIAEEDTMILALPVRQVDEWISKYRNWKEFVMMAYDHRIMELLQTIDSIAFLRMDERLLNYLEEKSKVSGSAVLECTHQDIARDLNASRESVSRLLKQLERTGIIKLGRNQIELINA